MRTKTLFAAAALIVVPSTSAAQAQALTFEDRVRAQEAIERVYYAHQIGATRSFEEAVPRAALEKKVRTYLEQSAALSITSAMLHHEVERMTAETKMPERLHEVFAALGNDPLVIEEALARPALADRLSRSPENPRLVPKADASRAVQGGCPIAWTDIASTGAPEARQLAAA